MSDTMSEVLVPAAHVHLAILVHGALTLLLSIHKVTFVLAAISPLLSTVPLPLALHEITLEAHFLLSEVIKSRTVERIILETALVEATVAPLKMALANLRILVEFTLEAVASRLPTLFASSVELVIKPLTFISVPLGWLHEFTFASTLFIDPVASI